MVIPLLIAGASVGLSAIYHTGKAIDNVRYWNDYARRYGVRPKYAFARGSYDYLNYGSKALGPVGFGARWWNSGYHPSKFTNYNNMYV